MPIYEGEQYTYEQLSALRKRNVCAECRERLDLYQNFDNGKAFIACKDFLRTGHEGIVKEASRYQKEGLASLTINERRRIMEKEYGTGMTTALERARIPTTGVLTQPQAMHILKLVYPDVPEDEIIRTAILCRDFGLHPLMKEVYIIPFKDKQTGTISWSTVLGIGATRKMVARQGTYSYIDNTPRIMTSKEQEAVFGEVDGSHIVAITKLRTRGGEEAQGYGKWPKDKEPQGTNKGNTKANMAFIRSERNAFGRLFSDAIPQGIDVIDEAYVDVPDVGKVIEATGEVIEGESKELPDKQATEQDRHWCEEHGCAYVKKSGRGGTFWYAHSLPEGKWCNEVKKKPAPKAKAEPQAEVIQEAEVFDDLSEQPPEPTPNTIEALRETREQCNWSDKEVGQFCNTEKGWGIREYKDLSPEQIAEVITHIRANSK